MVCYTEIMKPTHPLIRGAGYLGTLISQHYSGSTLLDYPNIDITSLDSIENALAEHNPDMVINCAAWTNTGTAEMPENRSKVFALNVEGPALLSMSARSRGIPLVHFSTGMMFDGAGPSGEGWSETDLPVPTGYYAQTKYWADNLILPTATQDKTLIFRIHTPISRHASDRNFLNRLLKFEKAVNIPTSVTVVEDLLATMDVLLEKEMWGLYNGVNQGTMSAQDLAMALYKAGLRETEPLPLTREELNAMPGAHQTFPILNTQKLAAAGCALPAASESVEAAVSNFS